MQEEATYMKSSSMAKIVYTYTHIGVNDEPEEKSTHFFFNNAHVAVTQHIRLHTPWRLRSNDTKTQQS